MQYSKETSPAKNKQSSRQRREQERARAANKKRMIWVAVGSALVLLVGLIAYAISSAPPPTQIPGLLTFPNIPGGQHISGPIGYAQTPPVGGPHDEAWQKCGIYDRTVRAENAVHSLEHGAVWITYSPTLPEEQVKLLQNLARGQRSVLLSPFEGLPAPVVASAWGVQLQLPEASDPRLGDFVRQFQQGPYAPEAFVGCADGVGSPVG